MNVHEILGNSSSSWDKEQLIRFLGDLHSDLDPGILFLLHLITICEIVLLCFTRCQPYNAVGFTGEADFGVTPV